MKTDTNKFAGGPVRTPTNEEISRRAYELWEQDGRPDGNEQQHWYQAEKELSKGGQSAAPASPVASVGTAASKPAAGITSGTTTGATGAAPRSNVNGKQPAKASAGRM